TSIPSLKITPPLGMCDSSSSFWVVSTHPATTPAFECLLTNGSRTTNSSRGSSQEKCTGLTLGFPNRPSTPAAMLNTDDIHPVLPAPVATRIPLDDCGSLTPFQVIR